MNDKAKVEQSISELISLVNDVTGEVENTEKIEDIALDMEFLEKVLNNLKKLVDINKDIQIQEGGDIDGEI